MAFWGPRRTRKGLFSGLIPYKPGGGWKGAQCRAEGRIQLNIERARIAGIQTVLVSDENMIGSVRANMRTAELYPAIGERMSRYAQAFNGKITRIALGIRAQDRYWSSAIAYGVARGHPVPRKRKLESIATNTRSWRDVVTDLNCAVPGAEICVLPYESYYANPQTLLSKTCKIVAPVQGGHEWLNRAPDLPKLRCMLEERGEDPAQLPKGDGHWQPFSDTQIATMQEKFADDLFWLAAGAGGLATMTEEAMPGGRGKAHRTGDIRGQRYDEEGYLDKTG
ncbi:MAG: hypothetical protein ABJL99_18200 [Aliishimia sp.]